MKDLEVRKAETCPRPAGLEAADYLWRTCLLTSLHPPPGPKERGAAEEEPALPEPDEFFGNWEVSRLKLEVEMPQ